MSFTHQTLALTFDLIAFYFPFSLGDWFGSTRIDSGDRERGAPPNRTATIQTPDHDRYVRRLDRGTRTIRPLR